MVLTDPIADMLTRIRNANMAEKKNVQMPHSKMKSEVARLLKSEGFIQDYTMENEDGKSVLKLFLKYTVERQPIIQGLRRISKPSCRKYVASTEVPRVLGGIGVAILSTSSGVMTDNEARKQNVGGEVLCYVW
jgi:small subunit ribosomal protein S8